MNQPITESLPHSGAGIGGLSFPEAAQRDSQSDERGGARDTGLPTPGGRWSSGTTRRGEAETRWAGRGGRGRNEWGGAMATNPQKG